MDKYKEIIKKVLKDLPEHEYGNLSPIHDFIEDAISDEPELCEIYAINRNKSGEILSANFKIILHEKDFQTTEPFILTDAIVFCLVNLNGRYMDATHNNEPGTRQITFSIPFLYDEKNYNHRR